MQPSAFFRKISITVWITRLLSRPQLNFNLNKLVGKIGYFARFEFLCEPQDCCDNPNTTWTFSIVLNIFWPGDWGTSLPPPFRLFLTPPLKSFGVQDFSQDINNYMNQKIIVTTSTQDCCHTPYQLNYRLNFGLNKQYKQYFSQDYNKSTTRMLAQLCCHFSTRLIVILWCIARLYHKIVSWQDSMSSLTQEIICVK